MRSHFAPLPPSGLVQRPIKVEPFILVAAPSYLATREPVETPAELARHRGLVSGWNAGPWRLFGPGGERVEVTPVPAMAANESTVLVRAAEAGLGIAVLPASLCRAGLRSSSLVRVLPAWEAGRVTTTLLMPHRRGQLPAVRATAEFLIAVLGEDGESERAVG